MSSTFQPNATLVSQLIPADEPLASCPVFASGIFFNSTYLVFVLNTDTQYSERGPFHQTLLTTYAYPIVANSDGSYGFGSRTKAAVTPFTQDPVPGLTDYAAVSCVRLIDRVYVFIADSDWQTVHVVEVTAQATPGVISAGLFGSFALPGTATGFVPVAQDGKIQFLYPDPTVSQIDSYVFDPHANTVTAGPILSVTGQAVAPFSTLSVADVPLVSGALNLCFTDASNNLWQGSVLSGAMANPTWIASMAAGGTGDLKAASGPIIGQPDEASVVYFMAGLGDNNPVIYMQAPLNAPGTTGPGSTLLGSDDPNPLNHNLKGTFVGEAYVPLPGTTSALLRVLVYGAVLGGGLLWLYLIPTGQLFPQTPVVTDTSKTDGLTPAQKAVYEQSWTLLGIVQGPPPCVDNAPAGITPTSAQIEFSTTAGATATVSYGASVSVGGSASGDIFSFSGSASYALKQTVANTNTFTIDQTFTLGDTPPNTGLVIVSQPTISNTEYQVYSPDGSTDLHFSFYLIQVTGVVTTMFDFDITNPSGHGFSAGLTALPASSDLAAWQTLTLPTLPQLPLLPPALTATEAAGTTSEFSQTTSQDVTTSNKVSISATFGVFGFTASVGFTWSNSTETSSSFTSSYSSTIAPLVTNNPVLPTDVIDVQIQPYILQTARATTAQLAGLVPTLYAGSTPWILTWRVLNYQTQGSGKA